jgi:hypothetical protein
MSDYRDLVLYGTERGDWALLDRPSGIVAPMRLEGERRTTGNTVDLIYLGPTMVVISRLYDRMLATAVLHPQEEIARMLGVTQQSVSRYARGTSTPNLSAYAWRLLVRRYFAEGLHSRAARR